MSTEGVYGVIVSDRLLVLPVTDELDALFAPYRETLSVGEVAELLGMTKQGIYLWLRDGVIPGYKVGTSWFILRDELKKALREGSNRRPAQTGDDGSSGQDGSAQGSAGQGSSGQGDAGDGDTDSGG